MIKALWNCSYLPPELPLQAGFIPVRLKAKSGTTPRADRFLSANLCSYARAFLEQALSNGDDSLFLIADCCDSVRRLADALMRSFPGRVFLLFLPRSPEHWPFFAGELRRLWEFLLEASERKLKENSLWEAIEVTAERRAKLREMEKGKFRGKIQPLDYFHALQSLNDFSQKFEPAPENESSENRAFLLGTNLDDQEIWEIFQELNLRIVGDDLCYGEKQGEMIWQSREGDPFDFLARLYLSRPPCPRMKNLEERWGDLSEKIRGRDVKGVLLFPTKYCDPFFYDLPILGEMFRESGIPFVVLEQDYSQRPSQQLRTRIEAMLEKR